MKLKFSLIAITLLGLMVAMPVFGHANEVAPQAETRALTEQEMQDISGAGKVCNVQTGCQRPCRVITTAVVAEVVPETDFYICGSNRWVPTNNCANDTSYQCGHWVQYAGPCGSRGARSNAGFECDTGCDGTTCPGGNQGFTGED